MSARDDYPLGRIDLGSLGVAYTVEPGVWHDLCDEIDRLRIENERLASALAAWQKSAIVSRYTKDADGFIDIDVDQVEPDPTERRFICNVCFYDHEPHQACLGQHARQAAALSAVIRDNPPKLRLTAGMRKHMIGLKPEGNPQPACNCTGPDNLGVHDVYCDLFDEQAAQAIWKTS